MYKAGEFDFEFKLPFKSNNFNVVIYKWKIIDTKRYGRKVVVQGYGNDGELYDGQASITAKGVIKNVHVDINSGRWE